MKQIIEQFKLFRFPFFSQKTSYICDLFELEIEAPKSNKNKFSFFEGKFLHEIHLPIFSVSLQRRLRLMIKTR